VGVGVGVGEREGEGAGEREREGEGAGEREGERAGEGVGEGVGERYPTQTATGLSAFGSFFFVASRLFLLKNKSSKSAMTPTAIAMSATL